MFFCTEHPDPLDQRLQLLRGGGERRGPVTERGHSQERGRSTNTPRNHIHVFQLWPAEPFFQLQRFSVLPFSTMFLYTHTLSDTAHTAEQTCVCLIAVSVDANSLMMFEHQSNCSSYTSHECRGKATKKMSLSKETWT